MAAHADALALPPVPPPAPATHPWRDATLAAMFVTALALPGLALVFTAGSTTLPFENRAPAPWPALAADRDFPAAFDRAFADRFGGRDLLLKLHHVALADAFRVSPAPNVLLGGDNWLYFLGEDGKSLERHHRGAVPIEDAEIAASAAELARRARFLAAHGIAYVVTVVPEKFTIYPEHLPAWAAPRMPRTPLDRLAAALAADGVVRFVDLRAPLRAAKARERVYYTSDSHWNLQGATVGYVSIMDEVQRALPAGRLPAIAPPVRPPYVPGVDVYTGDLARMTGYVRRFAEPDYASLGRVLADPSSRCARRVDSGADAGIEAYACDRAPPLRAVVYRDSMGIPLVPLLSENFSRVVYVSSRRLDPAFVLAERPDVVIEEMVERGLLAPAALPMP
jgi:hypothetical protein